MSLKYFREHHLDNGYVLSLDGVRVKFLVDQYQVEEFKNNLTRLDKTYVFSYPECFSDFKYRYLYEFRYQDDWELAEYKAILGFVFNGSDSSGDKFTGFYEFNPNKLGDIPLFWNDYRTIKSMCRQWVIDRVDIALDIPAKRENVFLCKDNRKYEQVAYSLENRTECLGSRSQIGRVKVYNKSLEAKLPFPLTRIEVTCGFTADSFLEHFPAVYDISQGQQLSDALLDLNDTDLAILRMYWAMQAGRLDDGMLIFNSMARVKKAKLRNFVVPESALVIVPRVDVVNSIADWKSLY